MAFGQVVVGLPGSGKTTYCNGLVYCMDYLEKNIDWLQAKWEPLLKDHCLLFDFPGQVELFSLHSNARNVIMKLVKKLDLRDKESIGKLVKLMDKTSGYIST